MSREKTPGTWGRYVGRPRRSGGPEPTGLGRRTRRGGPMRGYFVVFRRGRPWTFRSTACTWSHAWRSIAPSQTAGVNAPRIPTAVDPRPCSRRPGTSGRRAPWRAASEDTNRTRGPRRGHKIVASCGQSAVSLGQRRMPPDLRLYAVGPGRSTARQRLTAGFRFLWPQGRGGSSPPSPTHRPVDRPPPLRSCADGVRTASRQD